MYIKGQQIIKCDLISLLSKSGCSARSVVSSSVDIITVSIVLSCLTSFHLVLELQLLTFSIVVPVCFPMLDNTCSLSQVYWCVWGSQSEASVQHPAAPQDHQHVALASRPQLPAGAARPPGVRLQQRHRLRARSPLHHRLAKQIILFSQSYIIWELVFFSELK